MRTYTHIQETELLAVIGGVAERPAPGEQGSGAWFNQRIGKLTASRMAEAMDMLKSGKSSKAREDLKREIVAERLSDIITGRYVTPAMQWGIDNEQAAKDAYSAKTGNAVVNVSFFDHPEIENFGASPDGFVGPDGLIETKCPTTPTHIRWIEAGEVPEEYQPQMTVQLMCTGRKWVDFVSFDPRIKQGRRLFIKRFVPTPEYVEKVRDAAVQFLAETDALFELMSTE